jgi:hypothetical protein
MQVCVTGNFMTLQAVTFPTYIHNIPGSNRERATDYPD